MTNRAVVAFLIFTLVACTSPRSVVPSLTPGEVAQLLPRDLKERDGWAADITGAIEAIDRPVTEERACAVIAIIEQESGYQVDPVVKNLPAIVRRGLERKFKKLGPLAPMVVSRILKAKVPGEKETFQKRITKLRTESDLDRLFRDIAASIRKKFPAPIAVASTVSKLMGHGWLEDFNPVTTAGSMQVKVSYAKELRELRSLSDSEARGQLYTRKIGVRAGTARLLDYEAHYDDISYRFADYNAGVYSSRNAAFQSQLSDLTGIRLVNDGDLLSYEKDGDALDAPTKSLEAMLLFGTRHELSERQVRRAARDEKSKDFEDEAIWKAVRSSWEKKKGRPAPYASVPNVRLASPKLSADRSTQWFADSVKRRYDACRRRAPRPPT